MPAEPDRIAVAFARILRGAGLDVPPGATCVYADALRVTGLERRAGVYWAGRSCLLRTPEAVEIYDRAFEAFWDQWVITNADGPEPPIDLTVGLDDDRDAPPADGSDDVAIRVRWSPGEVLRRRDFAECSPAEIVETHKIMAELRLVGSLRRSRRRHRTRSARGRPDLRATIRRALRTSGEPIDRAFRAPALRSRRIVLLCDVSGSMEPYARVLVRFLHTAVAGHGRVEAFALGTRLTRLTRELGTRDPDAALSAAAARVVDWSGGTRLGATLRTFNDRWGARGMARGAIVVILSDGWDRGDPDLLETEMARLHRLAHRVVWVNPLKATAQYAPHARGMAAALPHVDEFLAGHSVAALEELAAVISR